MKNQTSKKRKLEVSSIIKYWPSWELSFWKNDIEVIGASKETLWTAILLKLLKHINYSKKKKSLSFSINVDFDCKELIASKRVPSWHPAATYCTSFKYLISKHKILNVKIEF